jgi:hypothetical protein
MDFGGLQTFVLFDHGAEFKGRENKLHTTGSDCLLLHHWKSSCWLPCAASNRSRLFSLAQVGGLYSHWSNSAHQWTGLHLYIRPVLSSSSTVGSKHPAHVLGPISTITICYLHRKYVFSTNILPTNIVLKFLKDYLLTFPTGENCIADVVLAVVPATVIYRLNMEMKKRVNLCILLGLGLM